MLNKNVKKLIFYKKYIILAQQIKKMIFMDKPILSINQSGYKITGKHKLEITDNELLDHLRDLSKQLGKTPSQKNITKAGKVSHSIYRLRFGSLVKAQQAAGLAPYEIKVRIYSNEELINHLLELAKKLGRTPSIADIIETDKIKFSEYYKNFGSFVKAQKAAGLEPTKGGKPRKLN